MNYTIEKTKGSGMSERVFNLIIGSFLLYGFGLTAIVQSHFHDLVIGWPIIIGYFISVIAGMCLSKCGTWPSILGYHLIVVPIGVIIGPFMKKFSGADIGSAIFLTGGITAFMMGVAVLFPSFCRGLGGYLFWALIGLITVSFVNAIFFHMALHWLSYVGVGIFSLYIAYDWSRAQEMERTFENAIDVVINLYLDIINLFLKILEIIAASKE